MKMVDTSSHIRVSFREDVVFSAEDKQIITNGLSPTASTRSISSGGDDSASAISDTDTSSHDTEEKRKYSKLRSSLTREQTNRNPFFFYQVTKCLGTGSMGDVMLVKKRRIGGSARRDIQEAVKRQQREMNCLSIPVVGGMFHLCIKGDLKVKSSDQIMGNSSHHSFGTPVSTARSFEDSFSSQPLSGEPSADSTTHSNSSSSSVGEIVYAMKSIHLDQLALDEAREELRNEINILKDLDHPNIVRAIETFEYRDQISIVMELCSGGDLYARDPYTEDQAAYIINSILSAIAYMHSKNFVHRDLKFENVLFVSPSPMSYDVKLIDFGLSKVYLGDRKLTDVSGTIYTMAPEVIMGHHTEKADMWSIGVIAFMLLASSLPFYGKKRMDVIRKIVNNNYHFKGRRWKFISREARAFIKSLLVLDPDERADAETALGAAWLKNQMATVPNDESTNNAPRLKEEEMAKASILRYAAYPKLKKMALLVVAHKSRSAEIGILRKLFKKYDSQHDGSIWFEEFCESMSGFDGSKEDLRSIYDAMDLSGSGRIRYTEFVAATIEAHGRISEARLAEAFDHLDYDDSGYITAEDLMDSLGHEVPREEIDEIIAEVDFTKDKSVSYSEFLALWEHDREEPEKKENLNTLVTELSSISADSEDGEKTDGSDAHAEFLKEKHHQNTLHTWAAEMQLPAKEFAVGCSFLHQASLGNGSDLEKLLEERPALVNFRDYDRRTALHIAASEGHVDICEYLIKKGARINRSDRWGGHPLDDAHRHRHADVINLLRDHGAKFGSTSQIVNLITAASEGNLEDVKTLLEFGSMDLNQGDYDHRTALHLAANEGHLDVVKLLCKAGADINVKDRFGDRPLDDARKAKKNSSAMVKILSGADAGAGSSSEQQAAIMHDLKDKPAQKTPFSQLDESQDEGMTPLSAQEFAMGCSVLHQAALGNQLVLEKMLLERPSLVNFRDYDRRTPLHIAASEGQLDICRYLVANGAKINRSDRWGGSPLDDAHRHRHGDVIKFLREHGAKFGSTSQGTNFITAASEGDREEVQAFLEYGSIDMNLGDYDKRTALHLAASEGRLEIVAMLCEAGADVNVVDRWSHRPLDDARNAKKDATSIIKLLLKHGARSTKMSTMVTIFLLRLQQKC